MAGHVPAGAEHQKAPQLTLLMVMDLGGTMRTAAKLAWASVNFSPEVGAFRCREVFTIFCQIETRYKADQAEKA